MTLWKCENCGVIFDNPYWLLNTKDDSENPICPICESLNIDLFDSSKQTITEDKE